MLNNYFSGSYDPQDTIFLLKVIDIPPLETSEREFRIQSGQIHYSEMIGPEAPPEEKYLRVYRKSLDRNLKRLALDFVKLALVISKSKKGPLTLVSIARSGTPVGAILGRVLRHLFKRQVCHYSISVIRDKGLDRNALKHILSLHQPESLIFIDGWTGKGVIARELHKSILSFKAEESIFLDPFLTVLSDPAGAAGLSVGTDDYLIPSCLLNSLVSGLISRTILNEAYIGPNDFHGCLYYENLKQYDLSQSLVDEVSRVAISESKSLDFDLDYKIPQGEIEIAAQKSHLFMENTKERFGIKDENLIKPGLGESTRVLLRRQPELLMVKNLDDLDLEHLLYLAKEKAVPVEEIRDLPYRAVAIIKNLNLNG
ncbi:MAG: cysteine protease StiP family protein [Deltaproteobacteria bacterium]|jgi:hypothetical protein|nr:cysteine protease StiP family protein [Deltaproteobacteria bacterium]